MKNLRIGTSGWMYDHWKGFFYPADLPKEKWLSFYQEHFDTVEINNTFYHLPKEETFKRWNKNSPGNFVFSVKASRFITHVKRLKDPQDPVKLFLSRAKLLKKNLGPILFQLPPRFKANPGRLAEFLEVLSQEYTNVFEFRDPSWFSDEIYGLLRKGRASFCIYSMPEHKCPHQITSKIVYIRMHGGSSLYQSDYSKSELDTWTKEIEGFLKKKLKVYLYFNNDAKGFAIRNALYLKSKFK